VNIIPNTTDGSELADRAVAPEVKVLVDELYDRLMSEGDEEYGWAVVGQYAIPGQHAETTELGEDGRVTLISWPRA